VGNSGVVLFSAERAGEVGQVHGGEVAGERREEKAKGAGRAATMVLSWVEGRSRVDGAGLCRAVSRAL
jgi:hypothetical protein